VLTWFFYRPLLRTMKQREADVTAKLQDAEERARQADEARRELAETRRLAAAEAEKVLSQAKADAARLREEALQQARQDVAALQQQASQRIQEQQRLALQAMQERVRSTALSIAATLLREAAGPRLHRALVEDLVEGKVTLPPEQVAVLRHALAANGNRVTVESAYAPWPGMIEQVGEALAGEIGADHGSLAVQARVDPSLVAGVRIAVETVATDLSLRHTLDELDQRLRDSGDGRGVP
jgi:F-type H+-transporting ATPase subunit b